MPSLQENEIENEIAALPDNLESGERTIKKLPHGGLLVLEHDVPYLTIYRKKPDDKSTKRLAKTGSSYLILGRSHYGYFKEFLFKLTRKMADRFGAFLLFEIYAGPQESKKFVIKGPINKLPSSISVLDEALCKIESRQYQVNLKTEIQETKDRHGIETEPLFYTDDLKSLGGTLIGIEIPPVYRDVDGYLFPVYFRHFRTQFAEALQRTAFEFLRVQTTSGIHNYNALGRRQIHEGVLTIDKKICAIQNSYSFLMQVAPVNIHELKSKFYSSGFEKIDPYHYRLLPVDPDLLKRKLYNLDIHEIDDPALAYIYDEKREEIDQELTMLKERGSQNFFYSSIRLYGDVSEKLLAEAKLILQYNAEEPEHQEESLLTVQNFKELAQKEFEYFRSQSDDFTSKIHIRDDVNIMMVYQGELYLPSAYTMTTLEADALIQHEIGTHVLTYYNGSKQQLKQLSVGLAGYDALQEGIAVLSEYLTGSLCCNRLRILAGRVVAGRLLLDGADFHTMFHSLRTEYGFSKDPAFNITSRMFQGGGLLKDIVYLKGLLQLREHLASGGNLEPLLAGKFALKHLPTIADLTTRKLLKPAKILPRYLKESAVAEKLSVFKNELPLYKMI